MPEPQRWRALTPYAIMVVLACIEPATHFWLSLTPPSGRVATGVHTGDSSHHLLCMESFANGFSSPFATCQAEGGERNFGYFAVPIFILYGLVGEFGRMLNITPLLWLGLVNGFGGFLLLWNVHRFLRRVAPEEGKLAFYLYSLGGGVGGIAYMVSLATGAESSPDFELWFYRFAQYELIEGQHLAPTLLMPRFYYTLPLALGFAALTALVETDRCRCPGHLFFTGFLLFITAILNLRLGPLFWAVGGVYLFAGSRNELLFRLQLAAATAVPVIAGSAIFIALLRLHPSYQANVTDVTRMCMLLLPFLFATLFHWPALVWTLGKALEGRSRPVRLGVLGLGAWLLAYGILYLGHQVWFGNGWRGGDSAAAMLASDGAILLAIPLFVAGLRMKTTAGSGNTAPHLDWIVLWFLGLLALAMFAGGRGWFLQFGPQRFMILLGPPMALLTAAGLRRMGPRWARLCLVLLLGGGILSNGVAAAWFQGPLGGRIPGQGPFAYLHYEYMSPEDEELLGKLPPGTIAVPSWSPIAFGEILVHQGDYQVLGGPGAMNLGDQRLGPLQEAVNRFFDRDTPDEERHAFVNAWCVDYVYCPDTCPVDKDVLKQLHRSPWLTPIAISGRGCVFRVDSVEK